MEIICEYLPILIFVIFAGLVCLISKSVKGHGTILLQNPAELADCADCSTLLKPLDRDSETLPTQASEIDTSPTSGSKSNETMLFDDINYVMLNCSDSTDERCPSFTDNDGQDSTVPIPLLKDVEGKLVFQTENLQELLDPEILKDREIAVVAIAGALRMGKSFLLNLLLRYLSREGWKDKKWLQDWDSSKDQGLKWRGGSEAHTRGILAWGKPIFVQRNDGKEIAVILLDTQGNFEHGRKNEENVSVFALSTLLSSMQIFNVKTQIQANDLDYLQCFVEFARTVSDNIDQSDVDTGEAVTYSSQFQNLVYLVRDWPNPVVHEYGDEGGKKYMETFMSIRKGTEKQNEVQQYLSNVFKSVECFLMPEPGQAVRIYDRRDRGLTATHLGQQFIDNVNLFADKFLNPDKIPTKRIGRLPPATAKELLPYMKDWADALMDNSLLQIPNYMNLVAKHTNAIAMDRAEACFIANMEQGIDNMRDPTWKEFELLAQKETNIALEDFRFQTQFGRQSRRDDGRRRLSDQLRLRKSELRKTMQRKRTAHVTDVSNKWLDESINKMKTHRGYFYTSSEDYNQIKKDCKALLMKKEKEDDDSVRKALQDANKKFDAMTNDVIRDEAAQNSKRKWFAITAVAVGAVAAAPVAGAAYAIGSSVLTTSMAGGGVGFTYAGLYLKRKLDGIWNNRLLKKKTD